MIISIASGKGGTGKTTIAVNLALSLQNTQLLDCDVEEPNSHIFLRPSIAETEKVNLLTPDIGDACDWCGECACKCQFHAIVVLPENVMVFPELCHGCGLCSLVCPRDAITEVPREIGAIMRGRAGSISIVYGLLKIGEAMATPVVKAVRRETDPEKTVIIDAPPGTSCPVIASVEGSDYCILVTEPTPFGLYDLKIAVEVIRLLGIPFGVLVNKSGIGDRGVYDYCGAEKIAVLLEIPYDEEIARWYSGGVAFVERMPEWKDRFREMFECIKETARERS
ncbi:MAG TPA: (4Fe-4S)-binding protein [Methanosarcinales archaeon]|nr:(4Fe-4S)-binding protein [Methanosarcinales archaeon]